LLYLSHLCKVLGACIALICIIVTLVTVLSVKKWLSRHSNDISFLFRYYDQLAAVEGKFPISENQVKWICFLRSLLREPLSIAF